MAHEEQDIAHGTQRGDPAKAANAIIAAVDADSHVRACCSANVALDTSRRLADRTGTSRRLTARRDV
jgi:hypothetical protein